MIRNLVFDVGGVLLEYRWQDMLKMAALVAASSVPVRLSTTSAAMASISCHTSTWPSQPAPAPMPIVKQCVSLERG